MSTWIAILRGINVSGARKLPMKELRELFEQLKCSKVRTYIQSGNVVFESAKLDEAGFAKKVEAAILKKYDYEVPVLVRALGEMKRIASTNPYLKKFLQRVSWEPRLRAVFAGKLNYSLYGFLDTQMIRLIMWLTKGPTNGDAVVDFTDWEQVDAFGDQVSSEAFASVS